MPNIFHLWLKPVEPLYSNTIEPDPDRADFARINNVVFMGYPPSLDTFLHEVFELDIIVARCDGFCGIGRACDRPYILPGAKLSGRVPHYRKVEWLCITTRGPTDPYEGFMRGLHVRDAITDITAHCSEGPFSAFL